MIKCLFSIFPHHEGLWWQAKSIVVIQPKIYLKVTHKIMAHLLQYETSSFPKTVISCSIQITNITGLIYAIYIKVELYKLMALFYK